MHPPRHFVCVFAIVLTSILSGCGEKSASSAFQEAAKPREELEFASILKEGQTGDAKAQVKLGDMYNAGNGVPRDAAKAVEWYHKAAAQGNADAQFGLGRMYNAGNGVPKDAAKAVEWYQKATAQGDAMAQFFLGRMYENGEGVPKDFAKAVEWYQKAAAQGNGMAQISLGLMYENGEGVPEDVAKAVEWYQKAAAGAMMPWAQFSLGRMYYLGKGVPKDFAKAVEWYQKAAAWGMPPAQFILGHMYHFGEGVPKDFAKAVEWYQKAAAQEDAMAQFSLGWMYENGKGVPKDFAKAAEWYQKAAAQGNAMAQFSLGRMYYFGNGVPKDLVVAYAWSNLAASQGEAMLVKEESLSKSEVQEGQRLSSHWRKGQSIAREGSSASAGVASTATQGALSKKGTGTLFIVGKAGQAVTNQHVVQGCTEVRIEGRDGLAKSLTEDAINDLALVKIPGDVKATATISSDPARLRQGEDIIVFGFPLNSVLSSGGNLTPGVVSAITGLGNNTNQIQITAPIQPGSSGSPVLNKKAEVVGVVSMKLSDSKMARATGQVGQSVNFAVSGQTLKTFLDTHNVEYRRGGIMSFEKSAADIADEARKWTLVAECWQ